MNQKLLPFILNTAQAFYAYERQTNSPATDHDLKLIGHVLFCLQQTNPDAIQALSTVRQNAANNLRAHVQTPRASARAYRRAR